MGKKGTRNLHGKQDILGGCEKVRSKCVSPYWKGIGSKCKVSLRKDGLTGEGDTLMILILILLKKRGNMGGKVMV